MLTTSNRIALNAAYINKKGSGHNFKSYNTAVRNIVAKNIERLFNNADKFADKGRSKAGFVKMLNDKMNLEVDQTNISDYFKLDYTNLDTGWGTALAVCEYFNVSMDCLFMDPDSDFELIDMEASTKNANKEERLASDTPSTDISEDNSTNIPMAENELKEIDNFTCEFAKEMTLTPLECFLNHSFGNSGKYAFKTSGKDRFIKPTGNSDTYHCYYPSLKKGPTKILYATLTFTEDNNLCRVMLKLDAPIDNKSDTYSGFAITLNADAHNDCFCYCFLKATEPSYAEIVVISFRMRKKEKEHWGKRIAEVISVYEDRPVIHRMILSDRIVCPKDYVYIESHLLLNRSEVAITETGIKSYVEWEMENIGMEYDEGKQSIYMKKRKRIIESWAEKHENVYFFKINDLKTHFKYNSVFLSKFRTYSTAPIRNKVVEDADKDIWDLLTRLSNDADSKFSK